MWDFIFRKTRQKKSRIEINNILERMLELLESSNDSIWSDMEVCEVKHTIVRQLDNIKLDRKVNKAKLSYLFLPTAPLQEIAMENSWVDEYMELAEKFDNWERNNKQ